MSGLLASPFSYDGKFKEGIVTNLDPNRFVCTVKTIQGQIFNDVTWLLPTGGSGVSGMSFAPNIGDKVLLTTSLSYPLILGSMPRMGTTESFAPSISGGELSLDAGNSSPIRNGYSLNPNKPKDFAPGDIAFTTKSGGFMGVLASGGAMIKASPLAQIFVSKMDDLIRVMARNYYRFSDASSSISANVKGALYYWFGVDRDFSRNRTNTERYNEAYGHIPAAEVMRGEPDPQAIFPSIDDRVRKIWLKKADGTSVMVETLFENGNLVVLVDNVGQTTVTQENSKWDSTVVNGTTSKITILPGSIVVDYNGEVKGTFNNSQIKMDYKGISTGIFDNTGSRLDAHSHYVHVDSSGVHLG